MLQLTPMQPWMTLQTKSKKQIAFTVNWVYNTHSFDCEGACAVESTNSSIGELLREQRISIGLTQKECAERAKITERQYQTFEGDERNLMTCSFRTAGKIINALEMDITSFFHGEVIHADFIPLDDVKDAKANEQLRQKREELGLTLKEVSERAGVIIQQYQKYEGGQRDLRNGTFQTASRVIEALEMDITAFFRGEIAEMRK